MKPRTIEDGSARLRDTRAHYDTFPYDVETRGSAVYTTDQSPVGRFVQRIQGGLVLDIGCGPGNLLPAVSTRAHRTFGLDISGESLRRAADATRNLPVRLVQGSALNLPFPNDCFDAVIATGSLHCTPDPRSAFAELCRVLRHEGSAFVALYRQRSYYSYLYRTVGRVARRAERSRIGAVLVNRLILLPLFALYVVAGRFVIHRKLTVPSYEHLLNYFADQFLSPVVSFHSADEVQMWAQSEQLRMLSVTTSHAGALISVELRKDAAGRTA